MNSLTADVLLSVTMLRPDEKSLLKALRSEGLTARSVVREDFTAVMAGVVPPPAVTVIRNLSHSDAISTARRLETLGISTLNSADAIEICNDKGLQALLFARQGIPHPVSRHAFTFEQVRECVAEVGWPAVVKPVSGSWGRGVSRVVDQQCLDAWVGGRESVDAIGKLFPVLVQEHIDKPGHDLRVIVVGRSPVVAIRRISDEWRTNTHLGAKVERIDVTSDIAALCERIVDVLGSGFYGVDLIEERSTGELKVLEVNANPEFARSSAIHGVDVAGHLASYTAERIRAAAVPIAV